MKKTSILVVEDDDDILRLETYVLRKEGFEVSEAASGEKALELAHSRHFDLIVLDIMLPDLDGLEVCRRIRSSPALQSIPIIMVTAKGEETDVVIGLQIGADDYIRKPFKPRELVARIRTVLRRVRRQHVTGLPEDVIRIGDFEIIPGRREARVNGKMVDLTFTEFEILRLLASKPGWVFTRYQIVNGVRGEDYPVTDRAVDVQIVGLRRKLGKAGAAIETVRGIGYRMRDPEKE